MKTALSTVLLLIATLTIGYSQATVSGSTRTDKQGNQPSTRKDPRPAPAPPSVSATNQTRSSATMGTPPSAATSQPTRGARVDYRPVQPKAANKKTGN